MSYAKLFPSIMIALNIAAAAVNFHAGDWRKGVYWMAAATLNTVVTF